MQSTKSTQKQVDKNLSIQSEIDQLVDKAEKALRDFVGFDQEQVDRIVYAMALAGLDRHRELARLAHEETGRGVYEDKIVKNIFATEYIWNSIKNEKTVGVVAANEHEGYVEVAEPVGIVAGVTPVTNPTSTTMFKALICIKARNPIVFGFHPSAQQSSMEAAKTLRDAAIAAGAPAHCVQWIEHPSVEATMALMNHPKVSLILATGGAGMVRSAYSCGKPALGVGPGNAPCYIETSANVKRACTDLMMSKTFDNGMICASEQAVIVDRVISNLFEEYMKENGCYFLNDSEIEKVSAFVINAEKGAVNPDVVGKSAHWIAQKSGVKVPERTKILIARLPDVGANYPLSREKLSPVLAYYVVDNHVDGFEMCRKMLDMGGLGHTAIIHSTNNDLIERFGRAMKVGRIIVNSPSSQGAIGDIYNTNTPSLTLGCGSYGHNSTTANVSTVNLINKKKIAKRRANMQWFKIPPKIYFEYESVQYLEQMEGISKAFIVTDPQMVALGYVDKVTYYLNKRDGGCHYRIFSAVEPDPDVDTVMRGVAEMRAFEPDVVIALGGGSPMDAAKGMWLFYEHPETSFDGLRQKFMDIRKRVVKFPHLGSRCKMVAIPTTSGTGSEVTAFTVITDKKKGIKYPLADYAVTPNVAIIDPQFVVSLPKRATADTGMDVLTHAIEAYVSNMANDYTDGLALQAMDLVFTYLKRCYENGQFDLKAREKMHNASCIAGMAFTNAFLGLNHSMAHKLGGDYHIPHGRANAILLPYVVLYNSQKPNKFVPFPKYERFMADEKLAKAARFLGFGGKNDRESIDNLVAAIRQLMRDMDMPMSIKETGVDEQLFMANVQQLSEKAHDDQCTGANPKYPLVSEIESIYRDAYYGR